MLAYLLKEVILKTQIPHADPEIDNFIFRLHYRYTVIALFTSAVLITGYQYFGEPIQCVTSGTTVPIEIINTYCWIRSTFTVLTMPCGFGSDKRYPAAYPGVMNTDMRGNITYQTYYQWIPIVLSIQAFLFYIPHYLWKYLGGQTVRNLAKGLTKSISDPNKTIIHELTDYIRLNRQSFKHYFNYYFFCQLLNLFNLVIQVLLINLFLNEKFTSYGLDYINYISTHTHDNRDPMAKLFPKVSKCTFNSYGPSGSLQVIDAICLLPINIVNQLIYLIMWFWFVILTIFSTYSILLALRTLWQQSYRNKLIKANAPLAKKDLIELIIDNTSIGEWFFINQLCHNAEAFTSEQLLKALVKEVLNKNLLIKLKRK